MEFSVHSLVSHVPASADCLKDYRKAQKADPICSQVMVYCMLGWPSKNRMQPECNQSICHTGNELTVVEDLLMFGLCIVVPQSLQFETMQKIHCGHQGIHCCCQKIISAVWWPGVSRDLETFIQSCSECMKAAPPTIQPLIQTILPSHPWERVAADLFELNKNMYLLVADYYSQYVEVQKLTSITSASVINALKAIFSRHGIPSTFIGDKGPQFDSAEMKEFAKCYNFTHITSSPHYTQSNGLAERMVKTVEGL